MFECEIIQSDYEVWGCTRVRAKTSKETFTFQVPGAAEVTTTAYGFKVLSSGAAVRTTYHVFRYKFEEVIPPTSDQNVVGAMVLRRHSTEPPLRLQPRLGSVFVVTIGPTDVIISSDDRERLSQVLREPLDTIAALTVESLVRPVQTDLPLFSAAALLAPPVKQLTCA